MNSKTLLLVMFLGSMFSLNVVSQELHLSAKGITHVETKIIDSLYYQKTFKDFGSLQNEVNSIKTKLTSSGFIESELLELKKLNDSSFLASFQLNRQFKTIRLYYDASINKEILKSASSNFTETYLKVDIEKLETTLQLLNSEFSNQGDPFSILQLSNIKKLDDTNLYANLTIIQKTQMRTIDSIVINGYDKFPKSFIKNYLKIKTKQTFNLKTIKDKMAELDNLIFASQIKDPEVLFTKDSTIIYMYLEKQKSNAFDGFLGFGTNEETSKLELNGYLNLNLTNNFNYGESFKLQYKSDESEQKTLDLKARLPFLFKSPLGIEFGLNIFRKDSTFNTVSQFGKIDYQINPKNLVSLGINSINSTNLLDTNFLLIQDYKSLFYILDYTYTKRQLYNLLFPVNFNFEVSTGIGNRTFETSEQSQTKFGLNSFKIFNLNDKNSIYLKLSGAALNSSNYFENELLRFGGINSIRGFEENSLTANLFTVLNTEYRYKLNNSLYIHSVLDAAYYENDIISSKQKLYGFGFGFGLLTKAGLFKFNYSNGKTENQTFKLSDSKLHLSLTASF